MRRKMWLVAVALVQVGCGVSSPREGQTIPAEAILDAAERSLGVDTVAGLLQLFSDAAVVGPNEAFRTQIYSSSDGRVRMEQAHSGFLAGSGRFGGWRRVEGGPDVDSLGAALSFVRGHELHMLALAPRSRLEAPRYLGRERFAGDSALAVAMSLPSGESLIAYFAVGDTVPVGLRMAWMDPPVIVVWSEWHSIEGLRVFGRAVFRQGAEEFSYRYDSIRIGAVSDSVFEGSAARSAGGPDA